MIRFLAILCILLACLQACKSKDEKQSSETTTATEPSSRERPREIDSLHWLLGNWQNLSSIANLQENWKQVNDTVFSGESFLISGNDTVSYETITLEQRGNYLYYIPVVRGQNNNQPVEFRLVSYGNNQFIFQNSEHDFPQKITYVHLPGDSLYAEISGMRNGKEESQEFYLARK